MLNRISVLFLALLIGVVGAIAQNAPDTNAGQVR